MSWSLPTSLEIRGVGFSIHTDYRVILDILRAYNDPDLPDWAKVRVMLDILYEDPDRLTEEDLPEAIEKGLWFIDNGDTQDDEDLVRHGKKAAPRLMDWDQDADLIIPAINRVYGQGDIRSVPYMHWWTFLGYYMEIGDCLFTTVLSIRSKKARGKKLEKWEKDFEKDNRRLVRLKPKLSEEEQDVRKAEEAAVKELFGIK